MQTGNRTNHNNGGNIRSKGNPSNHGIIFNRGSKVTRETRGTLINPISKLMIKGWVNRNNHGSFGKLDNEGNHRNSRVKNDLVLANTTKYDVIYLVVLDGTNHSLPYCYQHNGMDSNEYNIS
jgi:hypothetical protein